MQAVAAALKSPSRPHLVTVSVGRNKATRRSSSTPTGRSTRASEQARSLAEPADACAARTIGRTRPCAWARGAGARPRRRQHPLGDGELSRSGASHGGHRPARPGALRQRFEGDQRRRGGEGARHLRSDLLDRRRPGEGGRHRQPRRILSAHRQGLSDRRRPRTSSRQTLAGRVPHVIAGDLETAVRMAADDAALDRRAEPTVLLSPACASFDQFADFEARGEAFRRAVAALDAHAHGGGRMISRAHRSPLSDWWWTVDRPMISLVLRAAPDRLRASRSRRARRSPSGSASTACTSSCATRSTRRSRRSLMIGLSFLTPRQVRRAALVLLVRLPRADGAGALRRRGDQGLAALAVHRRHVDPALGADEAGLHRHHRLALRRGQPAPRRAGHACWRCCSSSSPRRCSSPSRTSARPSSSSPSGARCSSSPA